MEGNSLQVVSFKDQTSGEWRILGGIAGLSGAPGRGISCRRQSIKGGDGGQLNVNEGDHTNITEL